MRQRQVEIEVLGKFDVDIWALKVNQPANLFLYSHGGHGSTAPPGVQREKAQMAILEFARFIGSAFAAFRRRVRLEVKLSAVEGRKDGCWRMRISNIGKVPVTFEQMDWSIKTGRRRRRYVGIATYIQYYTQSITILPGRTLESSFFVTALAHQLKSLPGKVTTLHGRVHTSDGRHFIFHPGDELIQAVRDQLG